MKTKELLDDMEHARDEVREQERGIHKFAGDLCDQCRGAMRAMEDYFAGKPRKDSRNTDDRHYQFEEADEVARENFNATK